MIIIIWYHYAKQGPCISRPPTWPPALVDHEITLKTLEFVLSSREKVKPGFLLFSICIFSESNWTKS